jgi:twitching motility protein PilT
MTLGYARPMARLDMYVQHLLKHRASSLLLASGKPVTFRFPSGDRHSNSVVDHGDVARLVEEIAPRDVLATLMRSGRAEFPYRTPEGVDVRVGVEAVAAGSWTVTVQAPGEPSTAGGPSGGARPAGTAPAGGGAPVTSAGPSQAGTLVAAAATVGGAAPAVAAASSAGVAAPTGGQASGATAAGTAARAATPGSEPAVGAAQAEAPRETPVAAPEIKLSPGEPAINRYLRLMVRLGASDLHLSSDRIPMVRLNGEIQPLESGAPPLSDAELRELLLPIATPKAAAEFKANNDADFAHMIPGLARFRSNFFVDLKGIGAVFRQIPFKILSPEVLGIPKQVLDLCFLTKGLVLVTGPTGSGKSTTLATLIDHVNAHRSDHIITIEDPIEFVHEPKKCLINQREVGAHTMGFKNALRAALREDPDIVLVGEMRDLETIAIAVETAETGHLVFGTLHTSSAIGTIDRIIDQFPADRQDQIRTMLSESLKGVISQVLCKKKGGGRIAAYEVLLGNSAVSNLIREGKTFQLISTMQTGKAQGMQTLAEHLIDHVKNGRIEPKEAYMKATDKATFKELLAKNNIKFDLNATE